ncbi:DEAD/DEAH box helicase [Arthrobacter jiangjiafuii]|uniref:RNA helicase n=1 Tax=Arthrobacter jiangjiafuii TaxID=2817475 RepID=A0A975M8Q3_9MICC|nr:DEAD/DEAH box helicase [Arthrobacter jiangjiafuii]QWC11820.1 DEAD/DEAH box helicase [Arthrobacter jiangjiafuii]
MDDSRHLTADDSNEALHVAETLATTQAAAEIPELTFADFGVRSDIVESLAEAGITHPFPIQSMTLPVALGGHDIIGQAKTGTGKTLGFGIPAIQRVIAPDDEAYATLAVPGAPQALIVVPTRELAVQVAGDLSTAAKRRGARIVTIYGGRAYEPQLEALTAGVEIVVGTPGRLIDLYNKKHLSLKNVRIVVLDEADEMLDLGFLPDVETLMAATPAVRQTLLFSATMPGAVVAMARRYMTKPTHIRAADPDDEGMTKKDIRQVVYRAHNLDKSEVVSRILQSKGRGRTIIFTKTKRTAAKLSEELADRGFAVAAMHGDLGQGAREQAMRAFRNEKVDVLVATDVAARGIDVDDVTHVINYQCPEDEKTYLHRVGRTGRAGNKGTAVTFVDWDDVPRWGLINKALGLDQAEPVETYSSSPHLYTDLDIPEGTKGRLPRNKRTLAGINAEEIEDLGETGKKNTAASSSREGSRDGARSGDRSRSGGTRGDRPRGGDRGRSDKREGTRRSAEAPAAPAKAEKTPVAAEPAADRPRRSRTRTRRRNGEVVDNSAAE